jgi:hypothetical protein
MGNVQSGKRKYKINQHFFSKWNSQMAYILGFSCADGNVYERTLSWELSNKFKSNFDLLKSFNFAMDSDYPIEIRNYSYKLRVSNKNILCDIKKLGIIPNKKKVLIFPIVPKKYLSHFIRGFLDGDGWIVTRVRKNDGGEICVGFSNGSQDFMNGLIKSLRFCLGFTKFNLRKRKKLMKNGEDTFWYQLEFYSNNANKLLNFMYGSINKQDLFLKRKYEKFLDSRKLFNEEEEIKKIGRKCLRLESRHGMNITGLISQYLYKDKLIPREIADKFGVSLSTLYRWMDKNKVRSFSKRSSIEWSKRIINSKGLVRNA